MKKLNSLFLTLLFAALFTGSSTYASHVMGGELAYKCVGGMDYEFTLVIYRDCFGIPVSSTYNLTGLTSNCSDTVLGTLSLVDTAEVTSGCVNLTSTCNGGTSPGMEVYFYRDTITLPIDCDDWAFSVETCCRNAAITNLDNPGAKSFRFEALMNSLAAPCNDSPVFQELQMPFICDSVQFCLSNGVYDSDGDSLVYSMVDPIEGLNTIVPFLPGFNATDPFPTATGHLFDPITGNHCAIPAGVGAWVVAYRIDEFRNGVWIGATRREVQLWVVPCASADLTFTGTVTDPSNTPVTSGDVMLYEYGISNTTNTLVNTVALGPGGTYAFPPVANGQYIVRAVPDTNSYPTLASTYHTSTHYWVYADVLGAVCDSTLVADIQAVDQLNLAGSGYIEGYLGDLGLRSSFGVPWTDQEVVLETWPGRQHVRTVRSSASGIYAFNNVPIGNYRIIVDRPGSPMLGYYTVSVLPNGSYTGMDYAGDQNGITPYTSNSIDEMSGVAVNLVPNPVQSGTNLTMTGIAEGAHTVTIMDIQGRMISSEQIQVRGDVHLVSLPGLVSGAYLLRIDDGAAIKLIVE
jgi:hypothetical protein